MQRDRFCHRPLRIGRAQRVGRRLRRRGGPAANQFGAAHQNSLVNGDSVCIFHVPIQCHRLTWSGKHADRGGDCPLGGRQRAHERFGGWQGGGQAIFVLQVPADASQSVRREHAFIHNHFRHAAAPVPANRRPRVAQPEGRIILLHTGGRHQQVRRVQDKVSAGHGVDRQRASRRATRKIVHIQPLARRTIRQRGGIPADMKIIAAIRHQTGVRRRPRIKNHRRNHRPHIHSRLRPRHVIGRAIKFHRRTVVKLGLRRRERRSRRARRRHRPPRGHR